MSDAPPQEKVFRVFTSDEGKNYAAQRPTYPPELYDLVLEHHTSTGGALDLLLDVGCGPGNSTRELALTFDRAMGVDASPGMISSAKELGGKTASGRGVDFEVSLAEGFSKAPGLEKASVDLLTVAAAVSRREGPTSPLDCVSKE